MFNVNSAVVKIWFTAVLAGTYKYSDVPKLSNLREMVGQKLTEFGYDITEPAPLPETEPTPEPTPEPEAPTTGE